MQRCIIPTAFAFFSIMLPVVGSLETQESSCPASDCSDADAMDQGLVSNLLQVQSRLPVKLECLDCPEEDSVEVKSVPTRPKMQPGRKSDEEAEPSEPKSMLQDPDNTEEQDKDDAEEHVEENSEDSDSPPDQKANGNPHSDKLAKNNRPGEADTDAEEDDEDVEELDREDAKGNSGEHAEENGTAHVEGNVEGLRDEQKTKKHAEVQSFDDEQEGPSTVKSAPEPLKAPPPIDNDEDLADAKIVPKLPDLAQAKKELAEAKKARKLQHGRSGGEGSAQAKNLLKYGPAVWKTSTTTPRMTIKGHQTKTQHGHGHQKRQHKGRFHATAAPRPASEYLSDEEMEQVEIQNVPRTQKLFKATPLSRNDGEKGVGCPRRRRSVHPESLIDKEDLGCPRRRRTVPRDGEIGLVELGSMPSFEAPPPSHTDKAQSTEAKGEQREGHPEEAEDLDRLLEDSRSAILGSELAGEKAELSGQSAPAVRRMMETSLEATRVQMAKRALAPMVAPSTPSMKRGAADEADAVVEATSMSGSTVQLNEKGYKEVATICCPLECTVYARRIITHKGFVVCDEGSLQGLVAWYYCANQSRAFADLSNEIDNAADGPCAWIGTESACPKRSVNCPSFPTENSAHRRRTCGQRKLQASTSLTVAAKTGETRLQVASQTGFSKGEVVTIDAGKQEEENNEIADFGSIILKQPLKFDHAVDAMVTVDPTKKQLTAEATTYLVEPDTHCGYYADCGKDANVLHIAEKGKDYTETSKPSADCGPVCDASPLCRGFTYLAGRCLYRRNVTCGVFDRVGSACWVKTATR